MRDLRAVGADRVFREQVSRMGKRGALKRCLEYLREAMRWPSPSPTGLAWSTAALPTIETELAKRDIGLVVLSMAMGEREIMLERQRQCIAKAKAAGGYMADH